MLKELSIAISFLLFASSLSAQENKNSESNPNVVKVEAQEPTASTVQKKQKPLYQRRWSFGGNIGLSFWNGGTDILIAPKAYYHISPLFLTGFGLTYIHSSFEDDLRDYSQNSFGGSVMGAIRPLEFLQLSVEYEALYTNGDYKFKLPVEPGQTSDSFWNNAIYLGASIVSRNVSFGVRYDILYDADRSVYGSALSPVIGFYF